MNEVQIRTPYGEPVSAKIEVGDSKIIVHSRSGSAGKNERNPDYRKAVELILERLEAEGAFPLVYLDSNRVADQPLASRLLLDTGATDLSVEDQFDAIIRKSKEGRATHGAYSRLLIVTPRMPAFWIKPIIEGSIIKGGQSGLPAETLRKVRREHLLYAIEELSAPSPMWHSFGAPREYWLITPAGSALPAKALFGIALGNALRTYPHSYLFSSGPKGPAFRLMSDEGFTIEKRGPDGKLEETFAPKRARPASKEVEAALAEVAASDEERSWIEGNPKIAVHLKRERAAGLARKKKQSFLAENGNLWCERCGNDWTDLFDVDVADACMEVHHTLGVADMQPGHETKLSDLQVLCANCHRVTHRELAISKAIKSK